MMSVLMATRDAIEGLGPAFREDCSSVDVVVLNELLHRLIGEFLTVYELRNLCSGAHSIGVALPLTLRHDW